MKLDWQINDDVISVRGDLSHDTLTKDGWIELSDSQRSALTKNKSANLCLKDITHVDSAGLAWVLNMVRDAKKANVELNLSDVPKKLRQLASLSGVESLLPILKD